MILSEDFELKPSMIPQFNVQVKASVQYVFEEKLNTLRINGMPVSFRARGEGFYSIDIGFPNLDEKNIKVEIMGQLVPVEKSGLQNIKIQDRCGATAYHIPQGSLLIYSPATAMNGKEMPAISTTDIAPSLLRNYNLSVPRYMSRGVALA